MHERKSAEGVSATELYGSADVPGWEGAPLWFDACELSYSDMYCVSGSCSPK